MIKFEHVQKYYKDKGNTPLQDINFEVNDGEFVFIMGDSGAGKSTIINLLLKEISPSSGKILVNDIDVSTLNKKLLPFYRRKIGVVFQNYCLLPKKTVFENIAFALEVTDYPIQQIKKRVMEVINIVGLNTKETFFPRELSGGEQQRVAIARAIVNYPVLLMADEPTGNLDEKTGLEIMKIFNEINASGTTVIMATHDKKLTNIFKKRIIHIKDGLIL